MNAALQSTTHIHVQQAPTRTLGASTGARCTLALNSRQAPEPPHTLNIHTEKECVFYVAVGRALLQPSVRISSRANPLSERRRSAETR